MESRELAGRAVLCICVGIVNDDVVALRLHREQAVRRAWLEPTIAARRFLQAGEGRLELLLHHGVEFGARSAAPPLEAIELVEVEEREHLIEGYVQQRLRAEKRRRAHAIVLADMASLSARRPPRLVLAAIRIQELVLL